MNPMKVFKESLPSLTKVLESIHAYMEAQTEIQLKTLNILEEKNGKNLTKLDDVFEANK